mgnify:CR=1 FL=1
MDDVVARRLLRGAGVIVVERTYAGIGPDDIGGRYLVAEVVVGRSAEIGGLFWRNLGLARIARIVAVGRAEQREIVLVGNGEDDAAIRKESAKIRREIGALGMW